MNKEIYLTFDMEWVCDGVLDYLLKILESHNVSATFFVTHNTPLLKKIRENDKFELGIHPNFNEALLGQKLRNYKDVIDELFEIVPEAVSCRSHALTQNSFISCYLKEKGIKYDLNVYIPVDTSMVLQPYKSPEGCIKAPFFYEDDVWFSSGSPSEDLDIYFIKDGLKVFNFHPAHIYLNTEKPDRYEKAKTVYHNIEKLATLKNNNVTGSENMLLRIIERGKKEQWEFKKINQLVHIL